MKRNVKKRIKVLCYGLLVLGGLHSSSAWARCNLASAIQTYRAIQARDVMVDGTLDAGAPLGREGSLDIPANRWLFNCTGASNPIRIDNFVNPAVVDASGVYQFKVRGNPSGVGIRFYVSDGGRPRQQIPFDESRTVPAGRYSEAGVLYSSLERYGSAPVEYGPVDPPGVTLAESDLYNLDGTDPGRIPFRLFQLGDFNLVRPSCSMDAASLNQIVPLGNYSVGDFQGSTPSPWIPFNLVVANCSDPTILADITFGTASDADANNTDLFSMNPGGPDGLGIAISNVGTTSTAMLPGQTQTFPTVLTGQSFPFQAQLQPTTGPVTAGTINRGVTVVVNFK
jgi:type 1 fimbria pilin